MFDPKLLDFFILGMTGIHDENVRLTEVKPRLFRVPNQVVMTVKKF
jgi:hypothetical protein